MPPPTFYVTSALLTAEQSGCDRLQTTKIISMNNSSLGFQMYDTVHGAVSLYGAF